MTCKSKNSILRSSRISLLSSRNKLNVTADICPLLKDRKAEMYYWWCNFSARMRSYVLSHSLGDEVMCLETCSNVWSFWETDLLYLVNVASGDSQNTKKVARVCRPKIFGPNMAHVRLWLTTVIQTWPHMHQTWNYTSFFFFVPLFQTWHKQNYIPYPMSTLAHARPHLAQRTFAKIQVWLSLWTVGHIWPA